MKHPRQPVGRFHFEVSLENIANENAKIAAAIGAEFFDRVRAEHPIAFKLRFGKKLIGRALMRKSRVGLEVFVDVAGLIAVTRWFNVNDHAVRCSVAVHY